MAAEENSTTKSLIFRASNLDLLLALIAGIGMPILCGFLYPITGAFIPLLIYYFIFCILIVKWRKGTLEYHRPKNWALKIFLPLIGIQICTQIVALLIIIPAPSFSLPEVLLTAVIWAPVNAFMEQLIWIYVFDAYARRFDSGSKKILSIGLGIFLALMLVGLIHAVFWNLFLPGFEHTMPLYQIFFVLQFVITGGYLLLYNKTRSMLPIALIHIIADLALVLGAGYSILPYLFFF